MTPAAHESPTPVRDALLRRRSHPRVGDRAPTDEELLPLIAAAGSLADHSALRPWRILALRGDARDRLGNAQADAAGLEGAAAEKLARKPLRAPLLLAVIVSPVESLKVPEWEQEVAAAGVAHALSLLLDEAGWGVMWRTGLQARTDPVRAVHSLAPHERLLGWLYVGDRVDDRPERTPVDPHSVFGAL